MASKPLLTVAIVVQNQNDVIESTLTSLYELSDVPLELYIIDDASTDGSDEIIQSVVDYYQHDHTFYFDHSQAVGRGQSLNEALLQRSTSLFWAPLSIHEIDENQLINSLDRIKGSLKSGILQQFDLPTDHEEWLALTEENKWPTDNFFIWNLSKVPSAQRYFNPFVNSYCGLELAARLNYPTFSEGNPSWFRPSPLQELPAPSATLRQEILFTLLRRGEQSQSQRNDFLDRIGSIDTDEDPLIDQNFDIELLNEAIATTKDGRFNAALEMVEEVLQDHSSHPAAKRLKIKLLEKKRRFVEASELKHEVSQRSSEPQPQAPQEPEEAYEDEAEEKPAPDKGKQDPSISLIIPTAIYGKGALEHCLLSVSEHCNTDDIQLIVIDNASLDDTHDYVSELQEKQFMDCKVITNQQNAGFAASINQGLDLAETPYACIMHNDVELSGDVLAQLKSLMDENPDFAVVGPATNKTLNPDQAIRNISDTSPALVEAEYIDSFCLMMQTATELRMDESYGLAFFEDIDLCFQARTEGHKVGIAPHTKVTHHFGTTTFPLDLDTESKQYWKNVAYFNEKWEIEKFSQEELKSLGPFDQLLALDELVNPLYPEEQIKSEFDRLFTDEMKTEIFNTEHDPQTLCRLVHLFMVMGKRDVMRRLEDKLEGIELPATLIYQLVRFYYNRNIYSRCTYYLDQLQAQNESLRADLYRLAIHVENKDFDEAIPLLKHLLDQAPANPTLYKLAGDIHKFNGNDEEGQSFHNLAKQIDPFKFDETPTDAFGFEL